MAPKGTRGAHVKSLTGMLVLFFWVWNLAKTYFSGLANFFSYFSGSRNISAIFLGLTNFQLFFWVLLFLYYTLESFEWRAHGTEKQNHGSFSYSFKLWLTVHFESFYFLGFEFRVILFFWVVEICSRTSIPVKEMLVCPPWERRWLFVSVLLPPGGHSITKHTEGLARRSESKTPKYLSKYSNILKILKSYLLNILKVQSESSKIINLGQIFIFPENYTPNYP